MNPTQLIVSGLAVWMLGITVLCRSGARHYEKTGEVLPIEPWMAWLVLSWPVSLPLLALADKIVFKDERDGV